ncbi:MAG: hypothetical protein ACLFNU_08560 [Bacteroidales bacterium]
MRFKYIIIFLTIAVTAHSCNLIPDAISGATRGYDANGNSFYHRTKETNLKTGELWIDGEVKNPGKVNLRKLYKREVFYKEGVPNDSGKIDFVGAYRYRGYSLFDILNPFFLEKKNAAEFVPDTDAYIIIENDKGDKVVFSWAEIYLTQIPHQIIIATEQASIQPYKREVDYPKDEIWKIVAATDLYAFRQMENPTKITLRSFDKKHLPIDRELENPYSPQVNITLNDNLLTVVDSKYKSDCKVTYKSVFYGMGMGYHDTPTFTGYPLAPIVWQGFKENEFSWMRKGLALVVGKDGFRNILSVSELLNRADQAEPILAIPPDYKSKGHYRLYLPWAFYADFSVRNLAEIYFFTE